MVTFVAVENPAGLLGFKQREVLTDQNPLLDFPAPYEGIEKIARGASSQDKFKVYKERHGYFKDLKAEWAPTKQGVAGDFLSDAQANRDVVLEINKRIKAIPTARVLMCSSVNSMCKYIVNYCVGNPGTSIDGLIIFGHGGADSMNVGLGRLGGIGSDDLADVRRNGDTSDIEGVVRARTKAGMEAGAKPGRVREISASNKDLWLGSFAQLAPHAVLHNSGYFHLYLMACSFGEENGKPQKKRLVNMSGQWLSHALNIQTAVSAPTTEVTADELYYLIRKYNKICEKVGAGEEAYLNSVPLVSSTQ